MAQAGPSRPKMHSAQSSMSSVTGSAWGRMRPPSPTRSVTTTASRVDFSHPPHLLISRADLRKSMSALEELTSQAKSFRQAILAVSKATSSFGSALEACSRVKGCDTAADGLMALSGLKHMIGAHQQLIGDTFYREFEIPLLEKLDDYRAAVTDRQVQYEKALSEKSSLIRKTEHENIRLGRKKTRDLKQFREALMMLQNQVDELDNLKGTHYQEVLEAEDELWSGVLDKTVYITRVEMDVYDKIASKSTDPPLETLLSNIPDPFEIWGPQREEGQIFSVLSPLNGLMGDMKSPKPKLSRNTSTFRELRVTEEDEDEGDTTVIGPTFGLEESEEIELEDPTDEIGEEPEIEPEPFVLPSESEEMEEVLRTARKTSLPSENFKDDELGVEDTPLEGDDPHQDEAGNESGITVSSNPSPTQAQSVLGLSMPSLVHEFTGQRQPWQKIVWKRQEGYDDDYVPEDYLVKERAELTVTSSPPVWELLKPEIMPQFTFYSFVALFVLVFRALLEDRIYASQLNSFNMIILFGMIVMVKWSRNIPTGVTKTFDANTTEESNRLISWLLPPFVLYICSPLLLSLTKATTSDSIWPLAGCLFLLSSVLGGFGENVGFGKVDKPGHRRRGSVGELTLKDKSQSLRSCLSLTSTLSACIVMASRLDSGREVFALLSFVGLMIVVLFQLSQSRAS